MLTDERKNRVALTMLPQQKRAFEHHFGSVESCFALIEGMTALLISHCEKSVELNTSILKRQGEEEMDSSTLVTLTKSESWGFHVALNLIEDAARVGIELDSVGRRARRTQPEAAAAPNT